MPTTGAMTMDDLRDALGDIREFMGRHEAKLDNIKEQIEKQNGRVATLEKANLVINERVAEARGAWKAISAASALIGGGAAWILKHFIPLLFVAFVAHGQTGIKPDQLRATAPETAKPVLLAFSVRGFTPVALGPGIVATQSATGWTIDIAPSATPAPRIVRSRLAVTPAADGSYPLTENGVLFRNGLAMTAGVDYTFAAGRATPKTPWPADDLVVADEVTIQ